SWPLECLYRFRGALRSSLRRSMAPAMPTARARPTPTCPWGMAGCRADARRLGPIARSTPVECEPRPSGLLQSRDDGGLRLGGLTAEVADEVEQQRRGAPWDVRAGAYPAQSAAPSSGPHRSENLELPIATGLVPGAHAGTGDRLPRCRVLAAIGRVGT